MQEIFLVRDGEDMEVSGGSKGVRGFGTLRAYCGTAPETERRADGYSLYLRFVKPMEEFRDLMDTRNEDVQGAEYWGGIAERACSYTSSRNDFL